MSWRVPIFLLVFFCVKHQNIIPLMVQFNLSTICAFRSLCAANNLMLQIVWSFHWKFYVPLSVCITFRRLIVSLKICSIAFLIAITCLDLSGSDHAYLDKASITTIINVNPSLYFEGLLMSTRSICHCLSVRITTTWLVLKCPAWVFHLILFTVFVIVSILFSLIHCSWTVHSAIALANSKITKGDIWFVLSWFEGLISAWSSTWANQSYLSFLWYHLYKSFVLVHSTKYSVAFPSPFVLLKLFNSSMHNRACSYS